MIFDDLGVPWGSALGALGEPILDKCCVPFWAAFRDPAFGRSGAQKGLIFEGVFGTPPGPIFLTMLRMRAHFPGVHSGPFGGAFS